MMGRHGRNLAVLEPEPVSRPVREPRLTGPWLTICHESGRIGWRYDPSSDIWQGLIKSELEMPAGGNRTTLRLPERAILLIQDRAGRTSLTMPPRVGAGPVSVVAKDCDVVMVEVLDPRSFAAVFRALLEHACPDQRDRLGPVEFKLVLDAYLSRPVL